MKDNLEDLRIRGIILKPASNTREGERAVDPSDTGVGRVAGTCEDGNEL